jgi:hypothetical protein
MYKGDDETDDEHTGLSVREEKKKKHEPRNKCVRGRTHLRVLLVHVDFVAVDRLDRDLQLRLRVVALVCAVSRCVAQTHGGVRESTKGFWEGERWRATGPGDDGVVAMDRTDRRKWWRSENACTFTCVASVTPTALTWSATETTRPRALELNVCGTGTGGTTDGAERTT